MKKSMLAPLLFFLITISCGKEKKETEPVIEPQIEEKVIDFYNFEHYLEDSNYAYNIKITNILTTEHKDMFEVEKEKYGVPEKINGTSVTIAFDITNPYSKTMRIPFPEYYEIASEEFEGLEGHIYSRSAKTYIDNTTTIEDGKGNPLSSFSKYNDDPIGRKLIVEFKPNETKSIVVKFTDPFPSTINKITFIAFNQHLRKKVDDYYKLSEAEQEEYLADKSTQYGLVIDLKNKKLIDLISVNQ